MIRQLAAVLLHRDAEPDLPECGVMDGFVLSRADVADLPCRDAATRRVAFHCPGCGPRIRAVCAHHERALVQDPNAACEHCLAAGVHHHPVFMWSVAADAPLNHAYAKEEN